MEDEEIQALAQVHATERKANSKRGRPQSFAALPAYKVAGILPHVQQPEIGHIA